MARATEPTGRPTGRPIGPGPPARPANGGLGLTAYIAGAVVLTVLYFAFPQQHLLLWAPIGCWSVGAVLAGVRGNRPRRTAPWLLFAGALLCFAAGDAMYNFQTDVLGRENPFPSVADLFYVVMQLLTAAGLLLLVRARSVAADRATLLDALTVATGLGLLSWIYLILPYLQDDGLTPVERLISIAYPIGDVLVLTMLARLLAGGGARLPSLGLLVTGAVGLLVSDVLYGWIQLNGDWHVGGPVDLGWVVFYVTWGAAALHPSMRDVARPVAVSARPVGPLQIAMLALVSLIAPGVLLVESPLGRDGHPGTVAVFSVVLYLLVLARLALIVHDHRLAVTRERALRAGWAALVSAEGEQEIYRAALGSARTVAGARSEAIAGISVHGPDGSRMVAGELPAGLDVTTLPEDGGLLADGRVSANPFRLGDGEQAFLLVASQRPLAAEVHEALRTLASQVLMSLNSLRLAAEDQQRRQEAQFKRLIHNASDIILVADAGGLVSYASPSLERRLGWAAEDIVGGGFEVLLSEQDASDGLRLFTEVASTRTRAELVCDWSLRHRDGSRSDYEVVITDLLDDPLITGLVLTMRDVSERRELERQLSHQAFHDALTGLANRSLFHDRAEHALARTARSGGLLGMVVLDLDEFKVINDTRGHAAGDELLVAVSQRLTEQLRPGDTVARLGGDEFGLLLEDLPDAGHITGVVDRILLRLAEPFDLGGPAGGGTGRPVRAGASAGVVVVRGDEATGVQELLRNADLALYAAKDAGRGRAVAYHAELNLQMQERADRTARLRQALEEEQFVLLYQPVVEVGTGALVGVEALVRWQHPEEGLLGPGSFIPLCEESGLIRELGSWVLHEAGRQLGRWESLRPGLRMSVNVSAKQLEHPGFPAEVRAAIDGHLLPPGRLVLELTESLLVDDVAGVAELLHRLHGLGAQIALDDFGTGYSSLGYLQRFPIDILKIDKSFVDNLGGQDATGGAVARAVISLGHALQMQVVAEGIETVEQRDTLHRLGCGLGQGYLFAKPLPAARIEELLQTSGFLGPPVEATLIDARAVG